MTVVSRGIGVDSESLMTIDCSLCKTWELLFLIINLFLQGSMNHEQLLFFLVDIAKIKRCYIIAASMQETEKKRRETPLKESDHKEEYHVEA